MRCGAGSHAGEMHCGSGHNQVTFGVLVSTVVMYTAKGKHTSVHDNVCLSQGVEAEARTLVFLGWPGQNEPEDDDLNALDANGPALASPMHSQGSAYYPDSMNGLTLGSNPISAQMSQDTAEKMSNSPIGSKQLM